MNKPANVLQWTAFISWCAGWVLLILGVHLGFLRITRNSYVTYADPIILAALVVGLVVCLATASLLILSNARCLGLLARVSGTLLVVEVSALILLGFY